MCLGSGGGGGGGGGNKKKLLRPHLSFTILQSNSQQQEENMFKCQRCGEDFARRDNLTRHKKRRYDCGANTSTVGGGRNQVCKNIRLNRRNSDDSNDGDFYSRNSTTEDDDDIPYFDGDEFCDNNKPKTLETLNKMMKMLKIPEHRWSRIASGILEEDRARKNLFKHNLIAE